MEEKCTIGTETNFNFQNSLKHRIIIAQYIEELGKVFIGKNVVKRIISPSADLYEHIEDNISIYMGFILGKKKNYMLNLY